MTHESAGSWSYTLGSYRGFTVTNTDGAYTAVDERGLLRFSARALDALLTKLDRHVWSLRD